MKISRLSLIFIVLSSLVAIADEIAIEVIPLFNRPASEIQALLDPLLEPTDWVGADGVNLLLRTTPERLDQIKQLIDKLDTPQHNLIITVIQSRHLSAEQLNATRIPVNQPDKYRINRGSHYYQTQDNNANENTQTLRTTEGSMAYIKTGNAYPLQNIRIIADSRYPKLLTTTELIPATTGFAVTPRLAGQEAILEIAPWSDNMNAGGQIESQNMQAKIRVKLGEWIELGTADENAPIYSDTPPLHTWKTGHNNVRFLVKVEKEN